MGDERFAPANAMIRGIIASEERGELGRAAGEASGLTDRLWDICYNVKLIEELEVKVQ